ncbi:PREDICTED: insulin-like growth factor-binding protein 1 [Aptenodytes forsteri]|uniref:insulin-like growth factor-binding protein 1 n=1 Tax=Aptenodytes forsteri TaxID=9233 RepID=UPI0004F428EB|nr:PREDICTED: insulin-like growth factor-binding protein 1 [Aptenodytes forsteri]
MSSLRSLLRRCWLPSLLLPALLGPRLAAGVALQPMHCAPCTQEKLALCPPENALRPVRDSTEPEDMPLESTEMTQDQLLNYQLMFPIGQDKSIPWNAITAYENMKAKRVSELKKWKEQGPCQKELYRALYKLAKAQQRSGGEIYKFYLPNCNKNGLYHSKQCETSLDGEYAGCWCVYPKNGRRIPGSPEMKGDPECQQYLNSQE